MPRTRQPAATLAIVNALDSRTPAVVHADGTPCGHEPGPDRFARAGPDGYWCPAGERVTHVRFGGSDLDMAEAIAGLQAMAAAMISAMTPVVRAVVAALQQLGDVALADARLRVLAAACDQHDAEVTRERGALPELRRYRASTGDPCGDGQMAGQLPLPGT